MTEKHGGPRPAIAKRRRARDEDACPSEPGAASEDPKKNGCPRPDSDKDGIFDDEDTCLNTPGIRTDDPATNGCPPPKDTDKDQIIDPEDACPEAPGPRDTDPRKNGCPAARVEQGQIKILERVEFENNSAKLRPESDRVLQAVLTVMNEHPELTKLSVEGQPQPRRRNQHRPEPTARGCVMKWLTSAASRGAARLEGPVMSTPSTARPDGGRQNHRRVEFTSREDGHLSE